MSIRANHTHDQESGCLICGKPVIYRTQIATYRCSLCGATFESNAVCQDGHYVCDKCHAAGGDKMSALLCGSDEKDPIKLFHQVIRLDGVHMHGPEHHYIVPSVLLTAYRNNGRDIDLKAALETARQRGGEVPGGICGFWGACGAAIGAGIYASIVTGSNPLNPEVWGIPQRLTARCLDAMADIGGPRCCKRVSQIAIKTAARFTGEHFGVEIPAEDLPCTLYMRITSRKKPKKQV
jgi:hypothetical protein